MHDFTDKIAVVTGGGTGIGRQLVRQLAAAGARVAMCDVAVDNMDQTVSLVHDDTPSATVLAHRADVSDETQLEDFRDTILSEFDTNHIHLMFNNAGIVGGGSMITDDRAGWERCFEITWGGVYLGTRVFLPLLIAAPEAVLINISSVNGFYASIGPTRSHTAYSTAKFAVKGFSEALITDLRINAPHVNVALVMPGHIGTPIVKNTVRILAIEPTPEEAELYAAASTIYEETAPMSAAEAATIILDGVRNRQWRILVGDDAVEIDEKVRAAPETAYDDSFFTLLG